MPLGPIGIRLSWCSSREDSFRRKNPNDVQSSSVFRLCGSTDPACPACSSRFRLLCWRSSFFLALAHSLSKCSSRWFLSSGMFLRTCSHFQQVRISLRRGSYSLLASLETWKKTELKSNTWCCRVAYSAPMRICRVKPFEDLLEMQKEPYIQKDAFHLFKKSMHGDDWLT